MNKLHIRFGGYQNPNSIHNQAASFFLNRLKEKLGDQLVTDFMGNVLNHGYQSGDLPDMVARADLTSCYISTVRFVKYIPEISILDLPFLIKDRKQAQNAFEGNFGRYLKHRFEEVTPFKLLGIWDNGFRHITNKIRPISSPKDCVGLTIRTQMSEVHEESLAAMGFIPIPVDVKVFVDEIAGPRFDAQDNPLTNTYNFGVHHFHRYFTLTGHFFGGTAFICNAEIFQKWPRDIQDIFIEAADLATKYQWLLAQQEDDQILAKINPLENEIIDLTDNQREEFKKLVQPIFAKYEKIIPANVFQTLREG